LVLTFTVGLLGEPEDDVGAPVADVAADLEASGSGSEVAPVAEGALRDPEESAGFLEGEHLAPDVLGGSVVLASVGAVDR
jgi:hypothetical protein